MVMEPIGFIAAMTVIGLMVGSFANVCVYRIPRHESIVFPGSYCPNCNRAIAWFDNIPILGWLLLRGACRHCHQPISCRYIILECCMGLTWGVWAWLSGPDFAFVQGAVLICLLWVLTWIDLEHFLLPDVITFPGIVVGLLSSWWLDYGVDAVLGVLCGYGFFWLVAKLFLLLTGREGMGYGDFKLLAMLGAFLGWQALPFIVFVSSLFGAVIGVIVLRLRRQSLKLEIPFGPYLAAAGLLWLFAGEALLDWYLALVWS
ncbi:MAG: prepilin peptidase [Zetaproteobacteria bacterium]|nr:prepilin peptidase [Zetaproteobacteria bacterium]